MRQSFVSSIVDGLTEIEHEFDLGFSVVRRDLIWFVAFWNKLVMIEEEEEKKTS